MTCRAQADEFDLTLTISALDCRFMELLSTGDDMKVKMEALKEQFDTGVFEDTINVMKGDTKIKVPNVDNVVRGLFTINCRISSR